MHVEFLVEDRSGAALLEQVVPKIARGRITYRIHPYKGVGHLPKDLAKSGDPAKRMLLNELPRLIRGFGSTPGIDAVVIVVDSDARPCSAFLAELKSVAARTKPAPPFVVFRLAIEEIEAWLLGDRQALLSAYPRARKAVLQRYEQDSICGTWELLADAIHLGGSRKLAATGYHTTGFMKSEWARSIGAHLDVENNASPSFRKFRDTVTSLASEDSKS